MTDDPTNPRPDETETHPEEAQVDSDPASAETIQIPVAEEQPPAASPIQARPIYRYLPAPAPSWKFWEYTTTRGVTFEYDIVDWAIRIAFLVIGLLLGIGLSHLPWHIAFTVP